MLKPFTDRPRRLRRNSLIRDLVHETDLKLSQLVQPYFLSTSKDAEAKETISEFSGVYRWGVDALAREMESQIDRGLSRFLLFGSTTEKDATGSAAVSQNASVAEAIAKLKKRFGDASLLFSDICLCPYTDHGHCGVIDEEVIDNDASIDLLCRMALTHAEAGVDFVAPSDMMDGRVGAIRKILDQKQFSDVGILAYTAKYLSNYYGPFREALDSAPQKSDRSTYQMDYRNQREALRELQLDLAEGADIVMVKPALPYLDILALFAKHSSVPVAAYSVSGEYQMVQLAAKAGIADAKSLALENLTSIRRAGADIIFTYFAAEIAEKGWLR
ncbi:MAG: porphobilinogen synthase [Bdellovibrionales bacterium]|nr:porphobilinogen synthase [Bdellovibrionales bacterium]